MRDLAILIALCALLTLPAPLRASDEPHLSNEAERLLELFLATGDDAVHRLHAEFVANDRRFARIDREIRAWADAGSPAPDPADGFERALADAAAERSQLVHRGLDRLFPRGQCPPAGSVVPLEHPMFDIAAAELGADDPDAFFERIGGGVYMLEPFQPDRDVLLVIHGMTATPRNYDYLAPGLRQRYQVWAAYYPTGAPLTRSAEVVGRSLAQLLARHPARRLVVLTHSLGGLMWRSLPLAGQTLPENVAATYHMCSPHRGVHFRPLSAVRFLARLLWRYVPAHTTQLLEGSPYIAQLAALPPGPGVHRSIGGYAHHVWYRKLVGTFIPGHDDGLVPLASSVLPDGAAHVSLEEDHASMLRAPEVLRQLLAWSAADLGQDARVRSTQASR